MRRKTDYNYKEIITPNPYLYCSQLQKLCNVLKIKIEAQRSKTSNSIYIIIEDLNIKMRIADHTRMGWPPYESTTKQTSWYTKLWWWIGYHGPYQLNWWLKERFGNRHMTDKELLKLLFKIK